MQVDNYEARRLSALIRIALLDTRSDDTFKSLVQAATDTFAVLISTLSIIDKSGQVVFETTGLDQSHIRPQDALCTRTDELQRTVVILDASLDPLWQGYPLVAGPPHVRFYAAVPLLFEGQAIGTFCIIDTKPRDSFTEAERDRLERYAAIASQMLELRALRVQRDTDRVRFRHMAETSPDAMVVGDADGCILYWNGAAQRLFGYAADEVWKLSLADLVTASERRERGGFKAWVAKATGQTRELDIVVSDCSVRRMEVSLSHWLENGETVYGAVLRDVSERRQREDVLHEMAHRDVLTALPNRALMRERLEAMLTIGPVTVLLVDLDGFKDVNDTIGHAAGDEVLKGVAGRLRDCVRTGDLVARIGGDEFVVLVTGCGDPKVAGEMAERIVRTMEEPFSVQDRIVRIGASVGIAIAPSQATEIDDLLFCADLAVYKAKAEGRHRYRLYTPSLRAAVSERQRFVHEFHRAIACDEFVLHYQPQVRFRDRALVGAEALIRWQHPEHGLLQPASFLPALLASRHSVAVNDWVLRMACRQAAAWLPQTGRDFRMGVNACAVRLHSGEIADLTADILRETGLEPANIELEITETVVLAREGASIAALRTLRERGIGIAFDDFGTGYASLSLLEDFPLSRLKIDRTFVRKMNDRPDVPVIRAILQLAKGFGLDVIAEGIETEDQLRRLSQKGCEEGQGYLFSRPIPPELFAARFLGKSCDGMPLTDVA